MKKLSISSITILLICMVFTPHVKSKGNAKWELIKKKKGISVFTKEVKGRSLKMFMGKGIINSGIDVIGEVLMDIPAATEWLQDCIESKILKRNGYTYIVYNATYAPWPVSDRDAVIKSTYTFDFKKGDLYLVLIVKGIKHSYRSKKSRVRMPALLITWTLKYLERNKTHLTYMIDADPGGYLPTWLSNLVSKNIPYNTFKSLRKMVKKKKYINSAKTSELNNRIGKLIKEGKIK
ncbi:START domain-containing protein [Spirochaetota bacterium]